MGRSGQSSTISQNLIFKERHMCFQLVQHLRRFKDQVNQEGNEIYILEIPGTIITKTYIFSTIILSLGVPVFVICMFVKSPAIRDVYYKKESCLFNKKIPHGSNLFPSNVIISLLLYIIRLIVYGS